MIIDNEAQYIEYFDRIKFNNVIIHIIGKDPRLHPAMDSPSICCIGNLDDGEIGIVSIDHPDGIFNVSLSKIKDDINQKLIGDKWTFDKKKLKHYMQDIIKINDIGICCYLNDIDEEFLIDEKNDQTKIFFYNKYHTYSDLNQVIPIVIHKKWFQKITEQCVKLFDSIDIKNMISDSSYLKFNNVMSDGLWKIESGGMMVDPQKFKEYFPEKIISPLKYVYTEYNLFTSTGRPSNRFGGINFAALNKTDGSREPFISRYGKQGKLITMDYSAYHPHLIAQLINYNLPDDVYSYLGRYYYSKENLTEDEILGSKLTTFQLLYGHIPDKYLHIPYFKKINEYIHHRWDHFMKYGYVDTPVFKRRITKTKLKEPSPAKLFNYIIQASETEYNMEMLTNINVYCNNKLIKPILYTYDSLLFDIHLDEYLQLSEVKKIMSCEKFPIKCYCGDDYNTMNLISIE